MRLSDFLGRFRRAPEEPVKLIVGLGNPGPSYADTRHNAGWWILDHLAEAWHFDRWRKDHDALVTDGRIDGHRVRLLKPQTWMNLSGAALRAYVRRPTWAPATDLLVIVDDVALPVGRFRLRAHGSAGGHNGLKSIEGALGTRTYPRLRIGVGPPADRERRGDLADYVTDRIGKRDRATIAELEPTLVSLVETWLRDGTERAMNLFNRIGDGKAASSKDDVAD